MTAEEFLQIVTYNIARLQMTTQEFREEAVAEGYALGYEDALNGEPYNPPESDEVYDDDD